MAIVAASGPLCARADKVEAHEAVRGGFQRSLASDPLYSRFQEATTMTRRIARDERRRTMTAGFAASRGLLPLLGNARLSKLGIFSSPGVASLRLLYSTVRTIQHVAPPACHSVV